MSSTTPPPPISSSSSVGPTPAMPTTTSSAPPPSSTTMPNPTTTTTTTTTTATAPPTTTTTAATAALPTTTTAPATSTAPSTSSTLDSQAMARMVGLAQTVRDMDTDSSSVRMPPTEVQKIQFPPKPTDPPATSSSATATAAAPTTTTSTGATARTTTANSKATGSASSSSATPTTSASKQPSTSTLSSFQIMQQMEQQRRAQQEAMQEGGQVLPQRKVRELLRQIDATQEIDNDALELVMDVANEFIEQVVSFSCKLAKHRNSTTLEARDVLLHLERNWDIRLPGLSVEDSHMRRQAAVTSSKHKERVKAVLSDMKEASGPAKKRSKKGTK